MRNAQHTSLSTRQLLESYGFSSRQIPTELINELSVSREVEMKLTATKKEELNGSRLDFSIIVSTISAILLLSCFAFVTASHQLIEIAKPFLTKVASPNIP